MSKFRFCYDDPQSNPPLQKKCVDIPIIWQTLPPWWRRPDEILRDEILEYREWAKDLIRLQHVETVSGTMTDDKFRARLQDTIRSAAKDLVAANVEGATLEIDKNPMLR